MGSDLQQELAAISGFYLSNFHFSFCCCYVPVAINMSIFDAWKHSNFAVRGIYLRPSETFGQPIE